MSRFRNWTFTDFSLSKDYKDCLKTISYLIYGLETCPTTGNLHHQGYFELKDPITLQAIKKALKNTTIHLEPARGTPDQNKQYCSKEKLIEEWGVPKNPHKKKDFELIKEGIDKGLSNRELRDIATNFQSINSLNKLRYLSIPPRTEKPLVEWFWGPTGAGKSVEARKIFKGKENPIYDKIRYSKGFVNGYTGRQNCLWDDFRASIPFEELLTMLDEHDNIINVKGDFCEFSPSHIIITAPHHPRDYYKETNEDIEQLLRRITNIKYFPKRQHNNTAQTGSGSTKLTPPCEFVID